MQISVPDPILQTSIFILALVIAIFGSIKREEKPFELSIDHTNQIKGIAIMMVIFSHIGYFLDSGDKFLYPWSVAGGVGVNIFLFLSGYGLTVSSLKHTLNPLQFYWKRLSRIFLPMWIVLIFFLLLDYFLLNISYPAKTIFFIAIGFIRDADIYTVFNSPLWYFTLILFYYLVFPLVFIRKFPIVSVILIYLISVLVLRFELPVVEDIYKFYKIHIIAFPLGMAFALLQTSKFSITPLIKKLHIIIRYLIIAALLWVISYTAIHSGIGESLEAEKRISLITMSATILLFIFIPLKSKFLVWLGIFSYEIYLIQWPLLYRHDFLYQFFPAGVATILYFVVFIAMSFCIQKTVNYLLNMKLQKSLYRKE